MRVVTFLLACLLLAAPALAADRDEPAVRDCSTRAYGDLGRGWEQHAVQAGPLAFVGMRRGYDGVPSSAAGRAAPLKVLVVVEPRAVVTVTVAVRSRRRAALGYNEIRGGATVPLAAGTAVVRFEACARPNRGARSWNRGTQFPGYFLVSRPGCVDVVVRARGGRGPMLRTLRFGVARCG